MIGNVQTMLISELGMLVAKIGAADGPRGPDSAASRRMALTMGRLCEKEQPELKELNTLLNTWAGKMAEMMSRRAQAQLEMNQASAGLALRALPRLRRTHAYWRADRSRSIVV